MRKSFKLQILPAILALASLILPATLHAQLAPQGGEQTVPYSGSTAFVLSNTPVNPNLLVTTGTNTFIMNVTPPSNAARIYITNDTVNACGNLTVSVASSGNTSLNSFNAFPNGWQPINIQVGTGGFAATSGAFTLPASGAVAITTQPLIGSKMVVFIVLSAGCSTTNVDVQIVFGSFSPTVGAVQGVVPQGANASTVSPLLIGGLDAGNLAQFYRFSLHGAGTANVEGFPIGSQNSNNGAVYSAHRLPGGTQDGPLAATLFATNGTQSAAAVNLIRQINSQATCAATAGCPGLFVSDAGYYNGQGTQTITTGSSPFPLWQNGGAGNGNVQTCHFELFQSFIAGTAGTIDVFIQDSPDGTNWDDRIHFTQGTNNTLRLIAGIAGNSANAPIRVTANGTLAAGTITSGPLDAYGRALAVVAGGAAPQYSFSINANCK